ncbi:MAG: fibronectin type III domain-containing protein [Candidatus Pacebacteria bacterium]|nr:fibronectin type III domain-containing protein [Candidatus Paceibacterota bacterium]
MPKNEKLPPKQFFLFFGLVFVLLVVGMYLIIINVREGNLSLQGLKQKVTPPTPIQPENQIFEFSERAETFTISTAREKHPSFIKISFDPFKTKGGETQKLLVEIEDASIVTKVFAEVEDEIGKRKIEFQKVKEEDIKTIWFATWQIKITEDKEYPITFFAENEHGEKNEITLFWKGEKGGSLKEQGLKDKAKYYFTQIQRETSRKIRRVVESFKAFAGWMDVPKCNSQDNFPHKGSCIVEENLALSQPITGIDGGNLTIQSGKTLQLNPGVTFVFNPGKYITPEGAVALASGAKIQKGYLWIRDADSDGCGRDPGVSGNVTYTPTTASPGPGWRRVKDVSYWPDLDDNNPGPPPSCVGVSPPSAPSVSCSTISATQIDLFWTNVANEDGYKIYRCIGYNCTPTTQVYTTGADVTFWSDTGLFSDTLYGYRVKAYNAGGDSSWSNIARCKTQADPPDAPGSCSITASKYTVQVNENFTIYVSASDNDGVNQVYYGWGGSLSTPQYCYGSSSCTKSWSRSESFPGTYSYGGGFFDNNNNWYECGPITVRVIERGDGGTSPCSASLSCGSTTQNSITLNYSFSNCGTVNLYRGSTYLTSLGSGSRSGSYTDTGLSAGTSYTYYLKEGFTTIATITCSTQAVATLRLPNCPFSDSAGVWSTMGDGDQWDSDKRCRVGTNCRKSWNWGAFWTQTIIGPGPYKSLLSGGTLLNPSHRSKLCKEGDDPISSSFIPQCPFSGGDSGYLYVTTVGAFNYGVENNKNFWCRVDEAGGCVKSIGSVWGDYGCSIIRTWPGNSYGYRVECHACIIPPLLPANAHRCVLCYVP